MSLLRFPRPVRSVRGVLAAALTVVLCVAGVGVQPAAADNHPAKETLAKPRSYPPGKPPKIAKLPADPAKAAALTKPKTVTWPAASSQVVSMDAALATTGRSKVAVAGAPVALDAPAGPAAKTTAALSAAVRESTPSSVRVDVLDHAAAVNARQALLLKVSRADGKSTAGKVNISIDYSSFRDAYGADWANRLGVVELPACAGCAQVAVPSKNDAAASTVTATVDVAAAATTLTLTSGPSGKAGDFTATPLKASSTWSAGGQSGDFGWSYPMRVPPTSAGPAPTVGLTYSSQSVDGEMAASNNQPSWIGEGFSYEPGAITRSYKACSDDMGGNATNTTKTGDLCWGSWNATLSLAGHSGELIRDDADGHYSLKDDDNSKVERLTGASNGDDDGESWKVTTSDGTQYFFGLNRISGWQINDPETLSTYTVPVYGNNPGEPCYNASFASAACNQAWQWNLDYVVDTHGNTMSFWYAPETNNYAENMTSSSVATYTRGGTLSHIDYGTDKRTGGRDSDLTGNPPFKVEFHVDDRCITAGATCTPSSPSNWPDVPWDQSCTSSTSCTNYSPTFFTQKQLAYVQTWVRNAAGSDFDAVEKWTFAHQYPDPGDTTRAGLWLSRISHAGLYGRPVTVPDTVPDVIFWGTQLQNRVDTSTDSAPKMNWWRVNQILTETGDLIGITYSPTQCVAGSTPAADANTSRCYPVYWVHGTNPNPSVDWFHKYVVTDVTENDQTGGAGRIYTHYDYGTPAWHYDEDNGLVPASRKTWAQWRGYDTVTTTVGDTGDTKTSSKTLFFRGMNGDKTSTGTRTVQVTDSTGAKVNDDDAYAGMERETITYNGVGGTEVSGSISDPWKSAATSTRTINGFAVSAYHTGVSGTHERVDLDGGRGLRKTETATTFDVYGMPTQSWNKGDISKSTDDTCSINTYNRNTGANILTVIGRTQLYAKPCGTAPASDADVISDMENSFDGQAYGTAPTRGDLTAVQTAKTWTASSIGWLTISVSVYDDAGRIKDATDVRGNHTLTEYTPASGPVTSVKVTQNPLGWYTTKTIAPGYGLATGSVDDNGKRTNTTYDGLGRTTAVWTSRTMGTNSANATFAYSVSQSTNVPTVVTTNVLNSRQTYVPSYAFYDGLLRPRQTQELSPVGGRVITDTYYNSLGQTKKASGPYYDSGVPGISLWPAPIDQNIASQTTAAYDGAGRAIQSAFVSKGITQWHTNTVYGGDHVDVTPVADAVPNAGTPTSTWYDALGHPVELRQYPGTSVSGTSYNTTTYSYNEKGESTGVKDGANHSWAFTYDLLGRTTSRTDPDTGTTTTAYNDYGDLTSTTDAMNRTVSFDYMLPAGYADPLGRKTSAWQGQVNTGTKLATWTYDTVAKGYPSSSSRFVGTNEYKTAITAYNRLYQPTITTYTIPAAEGALAGSYQFSATYNLDGTMNSQSIPATGDLTAEDLNFTYDSATGLPLTVKTNYGFASKMLVQNTQYTGYGEVGLLTFADSATAPWVQQKSTYDPATHRVAEIKTQRSTSSAIIADTFYTYDAAGNLRKAADTPAGGTANTQCFGVDGLQRLTSAWTPASGDCTAAPSTSTLGGAAPYWKSWTFDGTGIAGSTGNRDTETTHATAGDKTVTSAYTQLGHPHAVSGTTTKVGATQTGTATYSYDADGNTISRPGTTGQQTLNWDPEGHLSSITEGSGGFSYVYDADGNRLIARDPGGTTLYLGNVQIRLSSGGAKTAQRYYSFNGQTVAQRTAAGVQFLTADPHGTSTVAVANTATQAVTKRYQDPYGNNIGPAVTWTGTKSFVGGDQDPTGLIHEGAREYDPALGRFVTVDPIQDLTDPQQWNGYAYAGNNPVTLSDPSGLVPHDPDLDDQFGHEKPGTGKYKTRTAHPHYGEAPKRGDLNIYYAGANNTKMQICVTDVLEQCMEEHEVTHLGAYIDAYNSKIRALRAANGGQELAEFQYLQAALAGCADGIYLEANCQGPTYYNLNDAAASASIAARDAAHPNPAAAAGPLIAAGTIASALSASALDMTACGPSGAGIGRRSFSGDTPVLLGDGKKTEEFKDLKAGDHVLATDPETGEQGPHKIIQVWVHQDDLYTLTIDGKTLTTTEDHPFWDATDQQWERADQLDPGDLLLTPTGATAHVDGFHYESHQVAAAYNLTVDHLHTYYVLAGNTPVLVHNDSGFNVPDNYIIMLGGQKDPMERGEIFSGNMGADEMEAGGGLPHGSVYRATAGQIRAAGGTVTHAPEETKDGKMNYNHVNITLGSSNPFAENELNPSPKGVRGTVMGSNRCG